MTPGFQVQPIDYASGLPELRQVRETVFVHEQGVPLDEEWDNLDPLSAHLIARDPDGAPIGTARLTPERRIGRMAVLAPWRGKGVGDALLQALLQQARERRWPQVSLHAQVSAEHFYARHGFLPVGERFMEAGIQHQAMRRSLLGAMAVERASEAVAATLGVIATTRRHLFIYSRDLDPGLLDQPPAMAALRRFCTTTRDARVQILLQDPAAPQRASAPLLALLQRLPSRLELRKVQDPVDLAYAGAYVANDRGGYYHRPLGHRFDGEADVEGAGRARQLREEFARVWERARLCTEFRALGI